MGYKFNKCLKTTPTEERKARTEDNVDQPPDADGPTSLIIPKHCPCILRLMKVRFQQHLQGHRFLNPMIIIGLVCPL